MKLSKFSSVAWMSYIVGVVLILGTLTGCPLNNSSSQTQSKTGVKSVTAEIQTQSNGMTVEQDNIRRRIEMQNTPGGVSYLYIVSAFSGEIILQSTVDGKVTSSGKRLSPYSVEVTRHGDFGIQSGIPINIGGGTHYTSEVLQDDGTYGGSIEYLYWWDVQGVYHQQYVTGGMLIHISEQPMEFGSVTIQVEDQ